MTYSSVLVEKVAAYIKDEMQWMCTAHDFFHIERVVSMAQKLHVLEWNGDIMIIEIWALMHESLDHKFFELWNMQIRKDNIKRMLSSLGIEHNSIDQIIFILKIYDTEKVSNVRQILYEVMNLKL